MSDKFRIGDYVGAQDDDMINPQPVFGRIHEIRYDGYLVRTVDGQNFGPYPSEHVWLDPCAHVDYPHWPGTLHGCPACEAMGTLED